MSRNKNKYRDNGQFEDVEKLVDQQPEAQPEEETPAITEEQSPDQPEEQPETEKQEEKKPVKQNGFLSMLEEANARRKARIKKYRDAEGK